ncbi:hypothetical protein BHE74_00001150 [Ensete ventricosum]|nr:hypothetical protein BHE74_00001150 [Ensete ventricosum]
MWSIQLQLKCFENSKQLMGNPLATCSEEAVNKQKGRTGQQTAGESEGKKKKEKKVWSPPHELSLVDDRPSPASDALNSTYLPAVFWPSDTEARTLKRCRTKRRRRGGGGGGWRRKTKEAGPVSCSESRDLSGGEQAGGWRGGAHRRRDLDGYRKGGHEILMEILAPMR